MTVTDDAQPGAATEYRLDQLQWLTGGLQECCPASRFNHPSAMAAFPTVKHF